MTTKILNHLRQERCAANIDADNSILFKHNRVSMFLRTENEDAGFCHVAAYSAIDSHQVAPARRACEYVSMNKKVAKAFVMENSKGAMVGISVECIHGTVEEFISGWNGISR